MIVRAYWQKMLGRAEGHFPPTLLSSEVDPSTDGTDPGTDAPGDSGSRVLGGPVTFTGRHPGPRRRRLNNNQRSIDA